LLSGQPQPFSSESAGSVRSCLPLVGSVLGLVECVGDLVVDGVSVEGGAVLEDGDGGDVGEGLRDEDVVVAQRSGLGAEVEGAD
jgi:hypothetical protein